MSNPKFVNMADLGPKKRIGLGASVALSAVALGLGVAVGAGVGSAASAAHSAAQPAPTKTVTVEVPAAVKTGTCRDVAEELWSMLADQNDQVIMPLAEGGSEGISAILDNDYAGAQEAIAKIDGANEAINDLTVRVNEIGFDYRKCVNP